MLPLFESFKKATLDFWYAPTKIEQLFLGAIDRGDLETVDGMLRHNLVDPNTRYCADKKTALHILAVDKNIPNAYEMAVSLVRRGASLDISDHKGNTPFHYAVWFENEKMSAFFMREDASLTYARNDKDETPLHMLFTNKLFCSVSAVKILERLIDARAPLSAQTKDGQSPLDLLSKIHKTLGKRDNELPEAYGDFYERIGTMKEILENAMNSAVRVVPSEQRPPRLSK